MRNRDDKQRARLVGELYTPLPGQDIQPDDVQVGPWSTDAMATSFRALQAEMSGGVK